MQLQNFVPYGHPVKVRLDMTMELGVDVRLSDQARIGLNLSPEFGMVGGFGFGMAARIGAQFEF